MKCSFQVALERRRAGNAYGAEVGEVETHRVVVDLNRTHVDPWRQANVDPAADSRRQARVVEVSETIVKFRQVRRSASDADQRMCERFESSLSGVVF